MSDRCLSSFYICCPDVEYRNHQCLAKTSSLQEAHVLPADFIAQINQNNYPNVLFALWIDELIYTDPATQVTTRYGRADEYINDFIRANLTIRFIEVLGAANLQHQLPVGCPAPHFIPNSITQPANEIASGIRARWDWM